MSPSRATELRGRGASESGPPGIRSLPSTMMRQWPTESSRTSWPTRRQSGLKQNHIRTIRRTRRSPSISYGTAKKKHPKRMSSCSSSSQSWTRTLMMAAVVERRTRRVARVRSARQAHPPPQARLASLTLKFFWWGTFMYIFPNCSPKCQKTNMSPLVRQDSSSSSGKKKKKQKKVKKGKKSKKQGNRGKNETKEQKEKRMQREKEAAQKESEREADRIKKTGLSKGKKVSWS
ncbi:unnamed protein product [Symbiodinium natans]|uniref:Uncharacterized protein n=1 Tax=Symbiodinium natans TaxID=878477 RepID=A0A812U143_9DINO|nr:unnamed protein product [Symbiodinium natans]